MGFLISLMILATAFIMMLPIKWLTSKKILYNTIPKEYYATSLLAEKYFPITFSYMLQWFTPLPQVHWGI